MEKPLYKVGDVLVWTVDIDNLYTVVKVRKDSYDLKSHQDGEIYKAHGFQHTHGIARKLTKLEKVLK